ncbi:S24 family peptidase [Cedecea colo]|uniref:S24 family peptidase n=1 Tax=Cedecea colo TaxID=2552946 RepID=A0ABX0VLU5_9ENTR|nr:S24 family peptidase [Cedecea colo]NIY47305.1 S24 family peptidase [Cedecea colo]
METKDFRRNNLRTLMDAYIHEGKTKAQFADAIGLPASQLSQLVSVNNTRNVGDIIARRVESSLGLVRGWLDVPHPDISIDPDNDSAKNIPPSDGFSLQNLSRNYTDHPYRLELFDTRHSCGGGRVNTEYPDIIQSIEVDPEYAKRMFGGRPATSLKLTTADGDSMIGTIDPGELVVIDVTVRNFRSDGIYAFTYGDASHIKRLQMLKDKIVVISDNAKYERWEINIDNESTFHIEGFIVGKWQMAYSRLG